MERTHRIMFVCHGNLAAFIILKADKIRKKKLYVLFIFSPMLRPKRYDDNFLYQYRLRY